MEMAWQTDVLLDELEEANRDFLESQDPQDGKGYNQ